jgi:hypothetical protein
MFSIFGNGDTKLRSDEDITRLLQVAKKGDTFDCKVAHGGTNSYRVTSTSGSHMTVRGRSGQWYIDYSDPYMLGADGETEFGIDFVEPSEKLSDRV